MSQPESLRSIAARLVREYREKRGMREFRALVDSAGGMRPMGQVMVEMGIEPDPLPLSGCDRELLRRMGVSV